MSLKMELSFLISSKLLLLSMRPCPFGIPSRYQPLLFLNPTVLTNANLGK